MEKTFVVKNPAGFHARPAAIFVKKAGEFPCDVFLVNENDGKKANAKSIISILALGIKKGDRVTLIAAGEKESEALQSLTELLESEGY